MKEEEKRKPQVVKKGEDWKIKDHVLPKRTNC